MKHEQSRNHPDATLTSKGFVQLSSATNSTSETLAATPKAVKAAYDLANGKYTAQDATTARKGIVQLSSATDSQREDRAATSKAVSEAMENAEGRLSKEQNGRDILDKASFVNNVGAARAYGRDISLGAGEWTTSEFVAWLKENGAFDQPYWMMKASLPAVMNKVITDTGLGKINLGGCAIEVMGTYDAAIVRVTIGEYGMTGFLNGTVCTCTVYGDTQRFYWRADYTTKNKPDAASTTQKGVVQLTSATDSTSETLAATAKAVKIAMDNASARLAKDRNGADIPNKPLFIQNVGLRELGTSGEKIPLLSTANTWTNRQTFSGGLSGELSGNAATATKLKTARTINGVKFDGSANIEAFPPGVPLPWPSDTPPAGYAIMQGQTFDKAAYPKLAIAYPSGVIPDMRGWTIKGKPASGRAVLSQEQDGIKSHTHSASASSTDLGTKTTSSFDYGTKSTNNTGAHTHNVSGTANSAGAHTHTVPLRRPNSGGMNFDWLDGSSSGTVVGNVTVPSSGAHTHSVSGTATSAGAHAHTVGIGAHTHSVAIGSHGHTITVNAAGNAENTVKNIAFNYIVRLA
ncbi:TPA: tail fiber protein [Escherichia coli]|nr:tail fiber protein [Escherichia coli]HAX9829170.1 tail fiber protein [Escherichia coli]